MARFDPHISRSAARQARNFQLIYPAMRRLMYASPALQFASKKIASPATIQIPTRHGSLRALVYAPTAQDIAQQKAAGQLPPVHLITHGGAFILRVPEQEDNVARYLASEVGAYVVIPDYDTAPQVVFPTSEEESYDAFRWVHEHGTEFGWDADRLTIGGASAGGKLAINVALMAIEDDYFVPLAIHAEYATSGFNRPDSLRTSEKKNPVVAPDLMQLVRDTYFVNADVQSTLVSPALHPRLAELPPILIETAGFDTLKHEMNDLARDLQGKGVSVTHHEFAGVDHGFTHAKPAAVAKLAIEMIAEHLSKAYTAALVTR